MIPQKPFPSAALLQRYLLDEAGPGDLVIVPHRRLARQVWHKERLASLEGGRGAWEPLPLTTLPDWWSELYRELWPPYALAPSLVRLALWRRALAAAPPPPSALSELEWAEALDEAHDILLGHRLPLMPRGPGETPLIQWRGEVTEIYAGLLRAEGWLAPGEVPGYLLAALEEGRVRLPKRLFVVALENPSPGEEAWLAGVARQVPLTRLALSSHPGQVAEALVFPDGEEEMAWVAARVLECHCREGVPLSRLAVTSPVMERYAPRLERVFRELLGPALGPEGAAFNLSRGPTLAETPLWAAALLPLTFGAQGERREDLVALLLSPYYSAFQPHRGALAAWDRRFREKRVVQGWKELRRAAPPVAGGPGGLADILNRLDEGLTPPGPSRPTVRQWLSWLANAWECLGFPGELTAGETLPYERLEDLLREFTQALGEAVFTPAELLAWLSHRGREVALPGPGREEAGVQVLGWLEMRGLDFDRVFCLGMNSGALPGAPRRLPLLSRAEGELILGGTEATQDLFAREMYNNLLGATPRLTLTRPAQEDLEPQVATPFYPGDWQGARAPILSRPDPAWARSPAVRAVFAHPAGGEVPGEMSGRLRLDLPEELRVTQLRTALSCPFRFVLEELLGIRELAEVEAGLDPRERGQMLHKVLALFVKKADYRLPPEGEALALLTEVARQVLDPERADPDWEAEWHRWFGDDQTPGLLPAWLERERQRQAEGWRWVAVEAGFQGLRRPGWPFALKGRLDRLDFHPGKGELMVWDYKTGDLPNAPKVFDRREEFQLPAYLWAVKEGHFEPDWAAAAVLAAGFIGLKSPREDHLRYQDYAGEKGRWAAVLAAWEEEVQSLGERLIVGEVRPEPRPAPQGRNEGACGYCPYPLICGYRGEAEEEEGEV